MTRKEARELAFILLFEKSFGNQTADEIIDAATESREIKANSFTIHLFNGADVNADKIDDMIYAHSEKWGEGRISRVAMSILRLAVFEMRFDCDVPESVCINEAVELAKTYGGDEDPAFVNGVLGGISRDASSSGSSANQEAVT